MSEENPFFAASSPAASPNVSALQEPFSKLASVPALESASPSLFGKYGGEPGSDKILTGYTIGKSFVYVGTDNSICGGMIGAGGRFCCRKLGECDIVSHESKRLEDLKPGLYLKSNGNGAYRTPFVSRAKLKVSGITFMMMHEFPSTQAARACLDLINESELVSLGLEDIRKMLEMKPAVGSFTPYKRKLPQMDLQTKFDSALGTVAEISEGELETVMQDPMGKYLKELTKTVEDGRGDQTTMNDNLDEVMAQIGVPPKVSAPSLWAGYAEHRSDIEDLTKELKDKASKGVEGQMSQITGIVSTMERKINILEANIFKAFGNVKDEFALVNASIRTHQASGSLLNIPANPPVSANLGDRLRALENSLTSFLNGENNKITVVRVGKYTFQTIDEVGIWIDKCLPPNYPFGAFIDVYSFLERVKARDYGDSSSVSAQMDNRRKIGLTPDEEAVAQAFQHPLPRCFRGTSSTGGAGQIGSWLPGVKSKSAWENKSGTQGVRLAIEDSLEGIRSRLEIVISQRLGRNYATGKSYDEAEALASMLLESTVTFIKSMLTFISKTHKNLVQVGYPEDGAWVLVTKLMYRFFATDCYHDKRGVAIEMLDCTDQRSMAKGVLWSTFATHQVMRSYLKHNFADHPSVSGEYTRFLVAHAGISKIEKAVKGVDNITSLVNSLEKRVEAAEKKATTASSRADEALKQASKKAKRDE